VQTNNLYRRPKSTFGAGVSYQATNDFSFGVNYKHTGNSSDLTFDPVTFAPVVVTLKQYNLVDLHLQYSATKELSFFGDVYNLLDVKYVDWLGYNTRRANFMLGANYRFK
jgi:vitamin B12 transporter